MFFSRVKRKIGIDIGTSSIKIAQMKKENDAYVLETYGVVDVAYEVGQKEGFDAIQETAKILKTLLERTSTSTKKIVASLPNNIVFVTMIEVPEMSEKELKSSIEWEAKRYVPLPLEEVTLSWSVLKESGAPKKTEEPKLKVLLTAVPTAVIDNYLKMFELAGLEPEALEIEALALIRSLIGTRRESFIIIDIGAQVSSVNLVDKGFLRVSRNLSVGGDSVTQAIAQSMKVSFQRAEQFKREQGLSNDSTAQIPQSVKSTLESIKNETSRLMSLYQNSGGAVEEIIFTGAGSLLPGLAQHFQDLGPKVHIGDPLQFITYDQRIEQHLRSRALSLSVAIGLGMRE